MKELYKSPVLNLLCLQPAERLANEELDFADDLGGASDGSVGGGGVNSDLMDLT